MDIYRLPHLPCIWCGGPLRFLAESCDYCGSGNAISRDATQRYIARWREELRDRAGKTAAAQYGLAEAYLRLGLRQAAAKSFRAAISREPENGLLYAGLAYVYMPTDWGTERDWGETDEAGKELDSDKAEEVAERACALAPDRAEPYLALAATGLHAPLTRHWAVAAQRDWWLVGQVARDYLSHYRDEMATVLSVYQSMAPTQTLQSSPSPTESSTAKVNKRRLRERLFGPSGPGTQAARAAMQSVPTPSPSLPTALSKVGPLGGPLKNASYPPTNDHLATMEDLLADGMPPVQRLIDLATWIGGGRHDHFRHVEEFLGLIR